MFELKEQIIDGHPFFTPIRDSASVAYHVGTDLQNLEVSVKHIPSHRNKLCIQAGGNLGFFPLKYASLFETVLTFEPDPQNFECLTRNVYKENVVKIQAALGCSRDWIDIESPSENHVGLCQVNVNSNEKRIPTLLIDDFNVPACDLIQLDLEGYEYFALQGASNTIQKYRPFLCIEMTDHGIKYGAGGNEQISKLLTSWGYIHIDTIWLDQIWKHKDEPS